MDLRELPTTSFRRHPWEVARADFFVRLVGARVGTSKPVAVLDVGAGDGYLARRLMTVLPRGSRITCFDSNYTDAHIESFTRAAPPGVTFARELTGHRVDWLLLLDVIEHVPNDVVFLGGLVSSTLAPGASALLSVPAWPALFSEHDEVLGHYRRYRPAAFSTVVERSGLVEADGGALFSSLLLPRALSKAIEHLRGKRSLSVSPAGPAAPTAASTWRGGPVSTAALTLALNADANGSRALARLGVRLPGLTLWARAIKK